MEYKTLGRVWADNRSALGRAPGARLLHDHGRLAAVDADSTVRRLFFAFRVVWYYRADL